MVTLVVADVAVTTVVVANITTNMGMDVAADTTMSMARGAVAITITNMVRGVVEVTINTRGCTDAALARGGFFCPKEAAWVSALADSVRLWTHYRSSLSKS